MLIEGNVGPSNFNASDGTHVEQRMGRTGDQITSQFAPRLYELCYRGQIFSYGVSNTALVAANAIATGLTATAQPILGVYNPLSSVVNMVILKAIINTTTIANTAVSPGGFMWLSNTGQSAISTGTAPWNHKTLTQTGGIGKAFAVGTALTGMTGSLAVMQAASFNSINAAGPATAVPQPTIGGVEFLEGAWIVPPGGVLAIMNQVATTTISVSTAIVWAEVPV